MNILSLDQALVTSAWALFQDDKYVTCGKWTVDSNQSIGHRLWDIYYFVQELVEKYEIEYIYFEEIQRQQNIDTYKRLAWVQTVIYLVAEKYNIPCETLAPSHWRKIIGDKDGIRFGRSRSEQKKSAQQFVETKFNQKVTQDEADAICIGYAAIIEKNKNKSAF